MLGNTPFNGKDFLVHLLDTDQGDRGQGENVVATGSAGGGQPHQQPNRRRREMTFSPCRNISSSNINSSNIRSSINRFERPDLDLTAERQKCRSEQRSCNNSPHVTGNDINITGNDIHGEEQSPTSSADAQLRERALRVPGGLRRTLGRIPSIVGPVYGEKTIGNFGSFVYLVNQIFGASIIALPFVIRVSGWLPCLLSNFLVACISMFVTLMMLRCMTMMPGKNNIETWGLVVVVV